MKCFICRRDAFAKVWYKPSGVCGFASSAKPARLSWEDKRSIETKLRWTWDQLLTIWQYHKMLLNHSYKAFSLAWPAAMPIYWSKESLNIKKAEQPHAVLDWDTNMAAVSLFWDIIMAAVTFCVLHRGIRIWWSVMGKMRTEKASLETLSSYPLRDKEEAPPLSFAHFSFIRVDVVSPFVSSCYRNNKRNFFCSHRSPFCNTYLDVYSTDRRMIN